MALPMPRVLRQCAFALASCLMVSTSFAEKRPLSVEDIMKFREIHHTSISDNGAWVAYATVPDRGDPRSVIKSAEGQQEYVIDLSTRPQLSKDGRWAIVTKVHSLLEQEKASKEDAKSMKNGLVLINTSNGEQTEFERVKSAKFTEDGQLLAIHFEAEEKKESPKCESDVKEADKKNTESPDADKSDKVNISDKEVGTSLKVIHLVSREQMDIEQVNLFEVGAIEVVFAVSSADGLSNTLDGVKFTTGGFEKTSIVKADYSYFHGLSINIQRGHLAFLQTSLEQKQEDREYQLKMWDGIAKAVVNIDVKREGRSLSDKSELRWSKDGERLFFGTLRDQPQKEEPKKIETEEDLFSVEQLLAKKQLHIWHPQDLRIKTNEVIHWDKYEHKRNFASVYHVNTKRVVHLGQETIPDVVLSENKRFLLGESKVPYLGEATWTGDRKDLYLLDLNSGDTQKLAEKMLSYESGSLSPQGNYVAYFLNANFYLYRVSDNVHIPLTHNMRLSFADEDHDYPSPVNSYGVAGWIEGDQGLLIYDKYDIWHWDLPSLKATRLTQGRETSTEFRLINDDDERVYFEKNGQYKVMGYNHQDKHYSLHEFNFGIKRLKTLMDKPKRFKFVAKAKDAERWLYTEEDFQQFPDLWMSDKNMVQTTRLSDVNPQVDEFLWGQKPELIEWRSTKGKRLQGVLIKPANYKAGEKVPVVVYYYRFFSQRRYQWNQMKVNHRPNFPFYTSNGYAIFLPDVKFTIGRPGDSATESLVPGIQKLIDMGIAKEDAIGLHGHSWSGYQTAFVVTQTDVFKAAVAGAPVSNMTSAYSGIRLGTGLARQFQYEMTQSRIGASLFDSPELYIENSPVFYADRINTPMLIQFGDVDEAVPWQQGVELYLAMKRLNKEVVFLQYLGEPHHLKQYPNKVDYTLKMKQYFDHHLKGIKNYAWIKEGEPYKGKD